MRQYRFGPFTLDMDGGFLRRDGELVELRPRPFELLTYLVERHGRIVGKDELIGRIWSGVAVTDNSLAQAITELRRRLGDSGRDMIRTVPRRGYVFASPVELAERAEAAAIPPSDVTESQAALTLRPIPAPVTTFFGRDRELHEIAARLERRRLLTLTGTGGTGKTRLAQEAARRIRDRFDGIAFVPLSSLSEPALVGAEIAGALGVPERPAVSSLDALISFIGGVRLLLVLDNFEHVAVAAPVVSRLLADCPNLHVLATSRAPLKIVGEHEYPVPPLAAPPADAPVSADALAAYPAAALFADRLLAVRPDFTVIDDEAAAIGELCRRLDGLPLAIELAAARTKIFTPRAMVARLDHALELLSTAGRDRPMRHHSLRQAIAWSYDLLAPEEQSLFRRLAIFIGGCALDDSPETAQALAPDGGGILQRCETLIDHNLVVADEGQGELPRLRMLETIREFALERLRAAGEMPAAHRAHATRFLALAEQAAPHLTGMDQGIWFDRLEREHANFRQALAWAQREGEVETALRLGAALWRFWAVRGYLAEGRERLEQLVAMPGANMRTRLRALVLHGAATLIHQISEYGAARPLAEECLAIARELDDGPLIAMALNGLGWLLVRIGDGDAAERLCEEALALNRRLGAARGIAVALQNLSWLFSYRGDYDRACALQEESLVWRRADRDPRGLAYGSTLLGWAEIGRGNLARARELLAESSATFAQLGDRQLLPWVTSVEGVIERADGRPAESAAKFAASLEGWRRVGNLFGIAFSLIGDARAALETADRDRAARDIAEALPLARRTGECWAIASALMVAAELAEGDGVHGEAVTLYEESARCWTRLGNRQEAAACARSAAFRRPKPPGTAPGV